MDKISTTGYISDQWIQWSDRIICRNDNKPKKNGIPTDASSRERPEKMDRRRNTWAESPGPNA